MAFNKDQIPELMQKVVTEMQSIFGDKLKAVKLFGSYARGDFDVESDVDIA